MHARGRLTPEMGEAIGGPAGRGAQGQGPTTPTAVASRTAPADWRGDGSGGSSMVSGRLLTRNGRLGFILD